MKIYLAGPMDYGHTSTGRHTEGKVAEWRQEIMRRASVPRDWMYPEMVETEYDNHGLMSVNIPEADLELVKQCGALLALVDSRDRYGTFCELAVASAHCVTTHVAVLGEWNDDLDKQVLPWFVYHLCDNVNHFPTREECIKWLIECVGGERVDYYAYIQSPEWRAKAEAAKERAGQRCQVCNRSRKEITLDAHHRTYERLGNELPEDITVLCRNCHGIYEAARKNGK